MPPIRILVAIPGLGSHDAGAKRVARACRDAGMEVIFLSRRGLTLEEIAITLEQEDVDVLGLSIHSGAHMSILGSLHDVLQAHKLTTIPIVVGGVINPGDVVGLKEFGVNEVFGPGSSTKDIVAYVESVARQGTPTSEVEAQW